MQRLVRAEKGSGTGGDGAPKNLSTALTISDTFRAHLTRYHGVFAPASPDRPQVVPSMRAAAGNALESGEPSATDRQRSQTWAQRLRRVFAIDIETCRRCGGQLKVIASIEEVAVIERILEHLGGEGEPCDPAHPRQAKRRRRQSRAPPQGDLLI